MSGDCTSFCPRSSNRSEAASDAAPLNSERERRPVSPEDLPSSAGSGGSNLYQRQPPGDRHPGRSRYGDQRSPNVGGDAERGNAPELMHVRGSAETRQAGETAAHPNGGRRAQSGALGMLSQPAPNNAQCAWPRRLWTGGAVQLVALVLLLLGLSSCARRWPDPGEEPVIIGCSADCIRPCWSDGWMCASDPYTGERLRDADGHPVPVAACEPRKCGAP